MRHFESTADTPVADTPVRNVAAQAGPEVSATRLATELQLTNSLALTKAMLESTTDGIVVAASSGAILSFNSAYLAMWGIPSQQMSEYMYPHLLEVMRKQLTANRADALEEPTEDLKAPNQPNILELKDGRCIERYSRSLRLEGESVGRVWTYRDVTHRVHAERALHDETKTLEVLNDVGATLAQQVDIESILQTVADAATQICRAEFGAFFFNTKNESGESYKLSALSGASRDAFAKYPLPRATDLFGPTFRGEAIVRSDDVLADARYGDAGLQFGMPPGHLKVRSYLAVPVKSRDGLVHGGLFFGHSLTKMFTQRDERILGAIASQAAIAIDNARLFESRERARAELRHSNDTLEVRVAEKTEALLESERQFGMLVAGVLDYGIYMLDPRGVIASWNPGAERIKGYSSQEIIGDHFSRFYTEEDRASGVPAAALATAEQTGKYEAEAWRVRKDGTHFWASVVIDAIRSKSGELLGFAKITRDMTERRAIQEQLHQSQKMEAIGQLTGGVAHDFNNLLTVILGNLETLTKYLPITEARLRHATAQATRGAKRAATLTQQLLAFSRRQPLDPKPTDINRLVNGVSDLMRRTLGETVIIETVLGTNVWRAEVDAHQLESALLNLAVNSRDAMPNGGKITIETANKQLDTHYSSRFAEIPTGQYVLISVRDNGSGMTDEVMSKAFNPFFTTKPIGEGTGLGLSQVYGFVQQSGGHIDLYSELNEGTVVQIYWPRLLRTDVEPVRELEASEPRGKIDETILVVEDDADVRSYSVDVLHELGFTVLEAASAESALRILPHHPDIQLVFTDVGLPGINGRELVDKVRELRPMMKVLFTTGYERNAIVHHGRLDHGVELLTKPFTRAQLATRIRSVLDAPSMQKTVLVVEDEELVRIYLIEILNDMGYNVLAAGSAAEALELSKAHAHIAVAIVDIGLPDRNGIELTRDLRASWPKLKIAIASGYGDSVPPSLHEDANVTFLAKPYNDERLREALRKLRVHAAS